MAYIDENGNITSTPPDPSKKREVNAEDIVIGVPKYVHNPEDDIRTGTISFFNESKGYGFIRDAETKQSIFVHINALSEPVKENMRVQFEVEQSPKGLNAVRVKVMRWMAMVNGQWITYDEAHIIHHHPLLRVPKPSKFPWTLLNLIGLFAGYQ